MSSLLVAPFLLGTVYFEALTLWPPMAANTILVNFPSWQRGRVDAKEKFKN